MRTPLLYPFSEPNRPARNHLGRLALESESLLVAISSDVCEGVLFLDQDTYAKLAHTQLPEFLAEEGSEL